MSTASSVKMATSPNSGISKSVPIVPSYRAPAATERLNTTTDSKASNTNYVSSSVMNKTKTSPTKQEPAPVLPAKVENGTKLTSSPKKTLEVSKKVEVADNQKETSSTKTSNPQMPVFISRVASIPAVNTAIDYAFGVYGKAKDSSPSLIKNTWSSAEETALDYANKWVLPVVSSLEKPINVVDSYACKTLDKVLDTLPIIQKSPSDKDVTKTTNGTTNGDTNGTTNGSLNVLPGTIDLLLGNRLGLWTLDSADYTVTTLHNLIDYLLPPLGENNTLDDTTPSEPSQKLIRTLRRSVDAIVKVNHRISNRAQRSLNQQTAKALVAVGGLRDLLAMVVINWKDIAIHGLPNKLHQLARQYRPSVNGDQKETPSASVVEDIKFLATHFANQCVEYTQEALKSLNGVTETQAVKSLRVQLSVAVAVTVKFASRVVVTLTPENVLERADLFLQKDFPLVKNALVAANNFAISTAKENKLD